MKLSETRFRQPLRKALTALSLFAMVTAIPSAYAFDPGDNENYNKNLEKQFHQLQDFRQESEFGREPLVHHDGRYLGNNSQLKAQLDMKARSTSPHIKALSTEIDIEPSIPEVKFYKGEDPRTLTQRIDALLHGVTIMLPSEYDLYGYELRRYMSSIAGPEVLSDPRRLSKEVANTKRAEIILEHWSKKIRAEIDAIGQIIEEDRKIDSSTRTSFKFNSGKAKAFLIEADSWVSNNRKMLEMLFDARNRFEYQHPSINFSEQDEAQQFLNLFRARQKSLEIIHEYAPFRQMVY